MERSGSTDTVDIARANSHFLTKSHLIPKSPAQDLNSVADDICGLHATSNLTPYLSLFDRKLNFSSEDLDRELYEKRQLVRVRVMRGTFFIVTRKMLPVVVRATEVPAQKIQSILSRWRLTPGEFQRISDLIVKSLSSGPKTSAELKRDLAESLLRKQAVPLRRAGRTFHLGGILSILTRLNRIWSSASPLDWTRMNWDGYGSRIFARITKVTYYPAPDPLSYDISVEGAQRELVRSYLERYGPVTLEDIAWWMECSPKTVKTLLDSIESQLVHVRIQSVPGDLVTTRDDFATLQEARPVDDLVLFLPYEDPYAKGFKVRNRLISPNWEKQVYVMGAALPTVISNGSIIGTWHCASKGKTLRMMIGSFGHLDEALIKRLGKEATRIGEFMAPGRIVQTSVRAGERTSFWQSIGR